MVTNFEKTGSAMLENYVHAMYGVQWACWSAHVQIYAYSLRAWPNARFCAASAHLTAKLADKTWRCT